MFKTSMEEIRSAYPYPVSDQEEGNNECNYCVGGAFLLYLKNNWSEMICRARGFPGPEEIAFTLHQLTGIPSKIALNFAYAIIHNNDAMEFELAWNSLKQALEWTDK